MKWLLLLGFTGLTPLLSAQPVSTDTDNPSARLQVIPKSSGADLIIRVGDMDFGGRGLEDPVSMLLGFPLPVQALLPKAAADDPAGTDRIQVPSSYRYGSAAVADEYTQATQGRANKPVPVLIPLSSLKGLAVTSAWIQLLVFDMQGIETGSRYQFRINGSRFPEAEALLNRLPDAGAHLLTIPLRPDQLALLRRDSLSILIDDPVTGIGDGFAIDFARLLINPRVEHRASIRGRVVDSLSQAAIPDAWVELEGLGKVQSDDEGYFQFDSLPPGNHLLMASLTGYRPDFRVCRITVQSGDEETPYSGEWKLSPARPIRFRDKDLLPGEQLSIGYSPMEPGAATVKPALQALLDPVKKMLLEYPESGICLTVYLLRQGDPVPLAARALEQARLCLSYIAAEGIDEGRIRIRGTLFTPPAQKKPGMNPASNYIELKRIY